MALGVLILFVLPSQGQRYMNEQFSSVSVTSEVEFSQNITILTGVASIDTLYMDVYEPVGDSVAERPLILILHSGFFLPKGINGAPFGTRQDSIFVEMGTRLAKMGYVYASIDYRLGWNPISSDGETLTRTFLEAIYRGVQDASHGVKFFKNNYTSLGNTFGIDTNKIVVGGFGEGGTIATCYNFLNDFSELNTSRMTSPLTNIAYIDTSLLGRWDGALDRPLNMDNFPGKDGSAAMAVNIGGVILDSNWIDFGENPIVSMGNTQAAQRPYGNGWIVTNSINGVSIAEVEGSAGIQESSIAQQNNALFQELNCTDSISSLALGRSNNIPGLFPFITDMPTNEVWQWWDTTDANHQNGIYQNPDMSSAMGRTYVDTILAYITPRIVKVLFEPERQAYFDGIHNQTSSLPYLDIASNGSEMQVPIFNSDCEDTLALDLGFVTGFSLSMNNSAVCPNAASLFEVGYEGSDLSGQPVNGNIQFAALGTGNTQVSNSFSYLPANWPVEVEVLENGIPVTSFNVISSNSNYSVLELTPGACLSRIDCGASGLASGWEFFLTSPANILINGGGTFSGDEIRVYPSGGAGAPSFVYVEEAQVIASDLEAIGVDAEWVQKFDVWHETKGESRYTYYKDSLTLGNIGTSGADGVALKVPGITATKTRFNPVHIEVSGAVFDIISTGEFNGAVADVGSISFSDMVTNETNVTANFSPLGSNSYTISLASSPNQILGSESFSNGGALTIQNERRIIRVETKMDTTNDQLDYWVYFDGPVDAFLGGISIAGDIMKISPDQASNFPDGFSEISFLGKKLNGAFTIIGNDSIILEREPAVVVENQLLLYPNPVRNILSVQQVDRSREPLASVEVVDLLKGKVLKAEVVRSQAVLELDVSELAAGIYLLRAYSKQGVSVSKFVKY